MSLITQSEIMIPVKKGDEVRIKPEWQDQGDDKFIWLAIEDQDGDRLHIQPQNTGLNFSGTQIVKITMIEGF